MSLFTRSAELYLFSYGVARYCYTSSSSADSYLGLQFNPYQISRGAIHESSDATQNVLDVTVTLDLPFLDLFRPQAPFAPISVQVIRKNVNGSIAVIWTGEVGSVEFTESAATIHCLPMIASLLALGLKRAWQKSCPLTLYGAGLGQCNASREAIQETATITGVTGNVVNAAVFAGHANGWWNGGYLEWNDGVITQRRFITDHTGDAVTLMTPAAPLDVGVDVTALPGCDHTIDTCTNKFVSTIAGDTGGNSANYGGQLWIPLKNPMGGVEVF